MRISAINCSINSKGSIKPNQTLCSVLDNAIATSDKDVLWALESIHLPIIDNEYLLEARVDRNFSYCGTVLLQDYHIRRMVKADKKVPKFSLEKYGGNPSVYSKSIESYIVKDATGLLKELFCRVKDPIAEKIEKLSAVEISNELKKYKEKIFAKK